MSFWHAGGDILRSKSLDRNSYDSGDWFNVLDYSYQTNGFGRGLPPRRDNEAKWPVVKTATHNAGTGQFTVPARTVAVFAQR